MRPNGSALEKRDEESISNLNNLSTEKKIKKEKHISSEN